MSAAASIPGRRRGVLASGDRPARCPARGYDGRWSTTGRAHGRCARAVIVPHLDK